MVLTGLYPPSSLATWQQDGQWRLHACIVFIAYEVRSEDRASFPKDCGVSPREHLIGLFWLHLCPRGMECFGLNRSCGFLGDCGRAEACWNHMDWEGFLRSTCGLLPRSFTGLTKYILLTVYVATPGNMDTVNQFVSVRLFPASNNNEKWKWASTARKRITPHNWKLGGGFQASGEVRAAAQDRPGGARFSPSLPCLSLCQLHSKSSSPPGHQVATAVLDSASK